MSAATLMTSTKRTSLIVYEADIFNCSRQMGHDKQLNACLIGSVSRVDRGTVVALNTSECLLDQRIVLFVSYLLDDPDPVFGLRFVNQQIGTGGDANQIGRFGGVATDYD